MNFLKRTGLPLASMILVCLYPCAFLYCRNAGEARAADMLPFFCIFLLCALGIFLVAAAIVRNVGQAALMADLGALGIMHFTLICNAIKKWIPGFHNMIFLALCGLLLAALLVLFLRKKPDMTVPCGLLALAFGVMTLVQLGTALPTILKAASFQRPEPQEDFSGQVFQGEKRNVYYLILDEYGGPENLEHYFGIDNHAFSEALEDRGFAVSDTTRNTESAWTVTLVPNMLNLQYVTSDDLPISSRLQWLEQPAIYDLFRNNGYRINLVNHVDFLGDAGCHVLTRNQSDDTISVYLYENSIFCQIPKLKWVIEDKILHRGQNGYMRQLEDARQAMTDSWRAAQDGPTLTVCYLEAPHTPFLFDQAGNPTRPGAYADWRRPELYLAKLDYTSQAVLETVDNIQTHDPRAVIVIQGDHGARLPGQLVYEFGGPWFDTEAEIPYMENTLNCVYVPEGSVDIEGDTCINTLRKTLDQVFGLNLGTLPVPPDYEIPAEYMPPAPEEDADGT